MCDTDIHDTWKMSYFHIVFDFKKTDYGMEQNIFTENVQRAKKYF